MDLELFDRLDADLGIKPTSRRDALRTTGRLGLAALTALPVIGMAQRVMASTNPQAFAGGGTDIDILNYALTLEYLERAFYRAANDTGLIPSSASPLFDQIQQDEEAHVTLLSSAISGAGGTPVSFNDSAFTFNVGGTDYLSSYALITALAQGFEDTGVRAYKGRAAEISNKGYLTVALQIHSVEARHAAAIRLLNGNQGWIPLAQPNAPAAIAAVYGAGSPAGTFPSEANTTQGGVPLTTALSGYTAEDISEAFDEPLDAGTVLNIAGPFIASS